MPISKDTLVDVLRIRYDAYSAEAVFQMACARAGLEGKSELDNRELAAFRDAVERVGDRVQAVLEYLDTMLGAADEPPSKTARSEPAPASKAEAKSEPAPASKAEAKSEPAPASKAEAKSEPAPASKAEAKSEPAPASEAEKPASKPHAKAGNKSESKPASDKPAHAGETTIVCGAVNIAAGEELMVCGGSPELGDWDPARARPMTRQGDEWVTTVKLAPDVEVAFKFLRRRKDGEITWEGGANRLATGNVRVAATWRSDN